MVGWLYTDSLVFFCLPLLCVMIMESPLCQYLSFWKRKRFGTMWPRHWVRSTWLCFPYYIAWFFVNKKKHSKVEVSFISFQVPCGDPKVFFFSFSFKSLVEGWWSPFYMHQKSVIDSLPHKTPPTTFLTLELCACLCFHFTSLSLLFSWEGPCMIRGVKGSYKWMRKKEARHDRMFMWVKI